MKKLRALVLAESCHPEWFSVPLVGWSHCEALHRLTESLDAHVVTQVRNTDAFVRHGWRPRPGPPGPRPLGRPSAGSGAHRRLPGLRT